MKHFFKITFFLVLAINQQAFSQQKDSIHSIKNFLLTERFVLATGLFVPSKSVKFAVNGNHENDIIDFGNTFNKQEATLTLNLLYRFSNNKKWSVGAEFFSVKASKQSILEDEINWGDIEYPIGVQLELGFNFKLYRLFFGRVISRGEKHELIGGLGIHALDINSYAQALGYIGNEDFNQVIDYEKNPVDLIAPVPNIGFKYIYALSNKWSFQGRADYFSLNTGEYKGYLWNLGASANYQFFNNMGIGLSYKFFNADLEFSKKLWDGSVNLLYSGPIGYVSFNF